MKRRKYLKGLAGAGAIGALAGCTGGGGGGGTPQVKTVVKTVKGEKETVVKTKVVKQTPSQKDPVIIGLQAPFTGMPKSALQEKNGAKLAVDHLGGTINGRPIELIYRDTALKPSRAARNARELVNEGAHFLAGGISSSVEAAIARIAGDQKILYMGSDAGSNKLTGEFERDYYPYYFRPHPSAYMLAVGLAQFLKGNLPSNPRITGIDPDYTWGQSAWASFKEGVNKAFDNPNVLTPLWPKLGTKEFGPFLTKLQEQNPDAVFTSLWGGDLISFIKQASAEGLVDQTKIVSMSYDMAIGNSLQDKAPTGVFSAGGGYWYQIDNPVNNKFREGYLNRYGKLPPARAAGNYTAVKLLADAAEKAGTVEDTQAIIDTLETETWDTVYGSIPFRTLDHQALTPGVVGKVISGEKPRWVKMEEVTRVPAEKTIRSVERMKGILCEPTPDNAALKEACNNA